MSGRSGELNLHLLLIIHNSSFLPSFAFPLRYPLRNFAQQPNGIRLSSYINSMNYKVFQSIFLIIIIFSFCTEIKNGDKVSYGGWDYKRIPLVEPFELIQMKGETYWSINTHEIPSKVGDLGPVDSIYVYKYHIIGYCKPYKSIILEDYHTAQNWFVVNASDMTIQQFEDQSSFNDAVESIIPRFSMYNPEKVYEEIISGKELPWE